MTPSAQRDDLRQSTFFGRNDYARIFRLTGLGFRFSYPVESEALFKYPTSAVHFSFRIPMPPLDTCVERLWLLSDAPAHSRERIAPSGTIDLVINLHENQLRIYDGANPQRCKRFSGAVVSGTHSGPFVIDPRERNSVMGVRVSDRGARFRFLGRQQANWQMRMLTLRLFGEPRP
jgi:hypothetical protein